MVQGGKETPMWVLGQTHPEWTQDKCSFFFSLSFSLPSCPPPFIPCPVLSLTFFFFHLFINPVVIDRKEIRALSSRSEGKGVVSSSSPPFLTGKGCIWRRPLSFLPQRLCFFPPVPPRFWRGLYNVLWRFCIGLARWLAYRHPDWEDSLSQFPHPQKGYETSTYFRGLL